MKGLRGGGEGKKNKLGARREVITVVKLTPSFHPNSRGSDRRGRTDRYLLYNVKIIITIIIIIMITNFCRISKKYSCIHFIENLLGDGL